MKKLNSQNLPLQLKEMLLEEILDGEYAQSEMLPSETELCDRFGISRGTLRHAVTSLEQEGYIKRRQGIGTIIDRNVCSIQTRFDQKIEFSQLIERAHYRSSVRLLDVREEPAGEENARCLRIDPGETLIHVTKVWLADERPAILCTDSFPIRLIREPYDREIFNHDIFYVLKNLCHQEVDYQIARIIPRCLNEELSKILLVPPNVPIISFDGVGFNLDRVPIICDTEFYATDILDFTLLRARI
jgi:DNA-binding GntR family transcriptional regulator